jgi:hypothetical protein
VIEIYLVEIWEEEKGKEAIPPSRKIKYYRI